MKKIILFAIIINSIYSMNFLFKKLPSTVKSLPTTKFKSPVYSQNSYNYFTQKSPSKNLPRNYTLNPNQTKIPSLPENTKINLPNQTNNQVNPKINPEYMNLTSNILKELNKRGLFGKGLSGIDLTKKTSYPFSSKKDKYDQIEFIEFNELSKSGKNLRNLTEHEQYLIVKFGKPADRSEINKIKLEKYETDLESVPTYYTEEEATQIIKKTIKETENELTHILTNNILDIIPDTQIKEELTIIFNEIVKKHIKTLLNSLKRNTLEKDIKNTINQNRTIEEKLKNSLLELTKMTINKFKLNFSSMFHEAGHALAEAIHEPHKNIICISDACLLGSMDGGGAAIDIGFNSTSNTHTLISGMIYDLMFNNIPKLSKEEFINFIDRDIDRENPHFEKLKNIHTHSFSVDLDNLLSPYNFSNWSKIPKELIKKMLTEQTPEQKSFIKSQLIKKSHKETVNEIYKAYNESWILLEPYQYIASILAGKAAVKQFNRGLTFLTENKPHVLMTDKEIYEIIESCWSLEQLKTIKEYQK